MSVDQLYYTWAEKGLEGLGRFQVVASTPRLARPSRIKSLALELCKYDAPVSSYPTTPSPVSYGWLTRGEVRFAFKRHDVGIDALGRPGNFAAHVMVARRNDLPPHRIAGAFADSIWWNGDLSAVPEQGTLTPLDELPDRVATLTDGGWPASEVLATLLSRGSRKVTVAYPAHVLMRTLHFASTLLPGILDELSVSSHEGPHLADLFDILGKAIDTEPVPDGFLLVRAGSARGAAALAGEFCVRNDSSARQIVDRAWMAVKRAPNPLEAFTSIAAMHQVVRGGGSAAPDQIADLLNDPEVASDLLRYDAPRQIAAREFTGNSGRLAEAVERLFNTFSGDVKYELADAIGTCAAALDPSALEGLVCRSAVISRSLVVQIAKQLVWAGESARTQVESWPRQLIEQALSPDVTLTPSVRPRLINRASQFASELAGTAVTDEVYGNLFAIAVENELLTDATAANILAQYPERIIAVDRDLGSDALAGLLRAIDPRTAVAALGHVTSKFNGQAFERLIGDGLLSLAPTQALAAAVDLRQKATLSLESWVKIVLQMYAVQREHVLVDVGFPLEFERLVELGLGLADVTVQSWCKLFAALSNYSQLTAVLAALDRVSAEELPEATRYTIDAVVATRPFITSLDEHISKIGRYGALNANVVATAVLAGALRGIRVYDTPVSAESGLRYVAQMFDRGELRQGLLSKERVDPAVHKLGKQVIVATTKSQRGHAALDRVAYQVGEHGRRWLVRIAAHQLLIRRPL